MFLTLAPPSRERERERVPCVPKAASSGSVSRSGTTPTSRRRSAAQAEARWRYSLVRLLGGPVENLKNAELGGVREGIQAHCVYRKIATRLRRDGAESRGFVGATC